MNFKLYREVQDKPGSLVLVEKSVDAKQALMFYKLMRESTAFSGYIVPEGKHRSLTDNEIAQLEKEVV